MSVIKKIKIRHVLLALVAAIAAYIYTFSIKPPFHDCREKKRNIFNEKYYPTYKIQVCPAGGNDVDGYAVLRVLSLQGELLAEVPIEYTAGKSPESSVFLENDRIEYLESFDKPIKKISMPPTWWDWIRARLP